MHSDLTVLEKAKALGLVTQEEEKLWKKYFEEENGAKKELADVEQTQGWLSKSAGNARRVLEDLKSGQASKFFDFSSKKDHRVMAEFREDLLRIQELAEDCEGALALVKGIIEYKYRGAIRRANTVREKIASRLDQAQAVAGRSIPSEQKG